MLPRPPSADLAGSIISPERFGQAPRLDAANPTRLADRRFPDRCTAERARLAASEEQPLRIRTGGWPNTVRASTPAYQADLRAKVCRTDRWILTHGQAD